MSKRVIRGSGWDSIPRFLRSADRSWDYADEACDDQGFRLVQEDAAKPDLVIRGGSWNYHPGDAYRIRLYPDFRFRNLGFRLIQEDADEENQDD